MKNGSIHISKDIFEKYEAVIGLEVHVQLSTETKAFSSDSARYGSRPNNNISPVSLALPGALPVTNKEIIRSAVKLGLALGCNIIKENYFDRKNYFYADLPKGYQITQDNQPVCLGGRLKITLSDGKEKDVILNRIHMEEDAGKSIHDLDDVYSLIDLNRAGIPLLEVVSEPVLQSGEEAAVYFSELRKLVRYLGICDGNLEEGSMRCDANISVRLKGEQQLGKRCEVKNLNSVKNLQKAIDYEILRQISVIEAGGVIEQNTLNFDAATGLTSPLRTKEMANDYRYFPEPDLLPLVITEDYISAVKKSMPALPNELFELFTTEFQLPEYDAKVLTSERETAEYFLSTVKYTKNYKAASNWIMGTIRSYLNDKGINFDEFTVDSEQIAAIINLIDEGSLNNSQAKETLFVYLTKYPQKSVCELILELNLSIDKDNTQLEEYVDSVLSIFADKVKQYHNGKKGVLGLFMGEIMKVSKGKIDPKQANKILLEKIDRLK